MANTIRIKRRLTGGGTGGPSTLAAAELAMNETSGFRILYYGIGDVAGVASSVIAIGGPDFIANSIPNLTGVVTSTGVATSIANSAITNAMLANGAVANLSGTNSGDDAVNSNYSGLISDQTVVLTNGTGITVTGTYPNFTVTNSAPDQTVALTAGTGVAITGTYPNFTVTATGGTVTSASVVSANGFAGTVATDTTTPAITISTSITGLLKGNGTAISAATSGTDYVVPSGNITGTAAGLSATLAVASGGTGGTTSTGSGAVVLANTPTLITPDIGVATGTSLVLSGSLTVNGSVTTISSTTLDVGDKNIVLASASTTDAGADGGGITIKGLTDKTWNWVDSTDAWTSSEHINIASGKSYYINGTVVLSATSLGSGIILDGGTF